MLSSTVLYIMKKTSIADELASGPYAAECKVYSNNFLIPDRTRDKFPSIDRLKSHTQCPCSRSGSRAPK